MPTYSLENNRSANTPGIMAIRLFEITNITAEKAYLPTLTGNTLTLADQTKVENFMQLYGQAEYEVNQSDGDQGILFDHTISFRQSQKILSLLSFNKSSLIRYYIAVIATSSGVYYVVGTKKQPLTLSYKQNLASGTYDYTLTGKTINPAQQISGIFNTNVLVGGTGTI